MKETCKCHKELRDNNEPLEVEQTVAKKGRRDWKASKKVLSRPEASYVAKILHKCGEVEDFTK